MHLPSSVVVERGFSLLYHIYAKRRHRLSHSTIEKLMIIHKQAPEFNTEEMGNILEHAVALFLSNKRQVQGTRVSFLFFFFCQKAGHYIGFGGFR